MRITKIISVISIGVAATTVPISMNLNNKIETTLKNKRNIYKNIDLINNSSLVDQEASIVLDSKNNDHEVVGDFTYDFENNEYYSGFITFKGNVAIYDHDNILKLIRNQPQVLSATKSIALENYYLVTFAFKKNSEDQNQFDKFLDKYDLVGDFYPIDPNQEELFIQPYDDSDVVPNRQIYPGFNYDYINKRIWERYPNSFKKNFSINGYTDYERSNAITDVRQKVLYENQERIGVAILEASNREDRTKALIDTKDYYYFDKETNVTNNLSPYKEGNKYYLPKPNDHATKVAAIVSGRHGVNTYHDLYGLRLDTSTNSSDLYSGLEDEIAYIKRMKNIKIVNNSWGILHKKESDLNNSNRNWFNYNYYSRYLDLLTANERELIFVKSAGNNGDAVKDYLKNLSSFTLSYNSIVVGSNDRAEKLSSFSSRGSLTYNAPLILATGEKYNFWGKYQEYNSQGTSFSAPFVSGVIANTLVQYKEKYKLGINSIIAKAILGVSSSNVKKAKSELSDLSENGPEISTQVGLNKDYGVGLLNYRKIKSAFDNLKYIRWTNNKQVLVNNIWTNKEDDRTLPVARLKLKKGDELRISLSWLFKPKNTTLYNTKKNEAILTDSIDYSLQDFELCLYKEGDKLPVQSTLRNNYEFIKIRANEDANYKIVVKKWRNENPFNQTELALSWTVSDKYYSFSDYPSELYYSYPYDLYGNNSQIF